MLHIVEYRLHKAGIKTVMLMGSLPVAMRQAMLRAFRDDPAPGPLFPSRSSAPPPFSRMAAWPVSPVSHVTCDPEAGAGIRRRGGVSLLPPHTNTNTNPHTPTPAHVYLSPLRGTAIS